MQTTIFRRNWLNYAALLLVLPAAWFISINFLDELGVHGPYNTSQPVLVTLGIQETLGWNINLLILFGPVIAWLISAWQVLHMDWLSSKEQFQFHVTVRRKWLPLFISFLSSLLLAILFFYMAGENL
jgi:hypothetical protein